MAQFSPPNDLDDIDHWPEPDAETQTQGTESETVRFASAAGFIPDAPSIAAGESATVEQQGDGSGLPGAETPRVSSPALAPTENAQGEDIETVAARRALEQAGRGHFVLPLSWLLTAAFGLLLLDAILIGWRHEIVRLAPQTASLYAAIGLPVNLRGLELTEVTVETQMNNGALLLLVQGQIVSAALHTVEVPRLRFAVRGAGGKEIYSWTALPGRSLLSPGESLAFQSRLAAPPPETREVLVRFFNRQDLAASTQ